ncbi:MAG: Gfo/Idh/MocA family oxidoreductase, partial [Gemmatimonadaceae bacterium]
MQSPVRIAVVGAGAIAQLAHLPLLAKLRGAQLVALCDNDQAKARALADRFDIRDAFSDIDELLAYDQVDAAIVATPNHLHEPHILQLLASGVDVFCERPLSLTSKGVERILAAAARAGRKVLVGNNHRFRSDVQALVSFLSGGELGRLEGVRSGSYHRRGTIEGWRLRRLESGGGALFEQGFPLIDLAMWLSDFPAPERVWAHVNRPRKGNVVEESGFVALECANGVSFTFDISWAYVGPDERWWFETLHERGSSRLAPLRVVKELNGRPVDVSPTGAAA